MVAVVFRQDKEDLSKLDLGKVLGKDLLSKFRTWLQRRSMSAGEGLYYLVWHALAFYEDTELEDDPGCSSHKSPDKGISKLRCPACDCALVCTVLNQANVNFVLLDKEELIFYYVIPPRRGEDVALSGLNCPSCGEEYDMKTLAEDVTKRVQVALGDDTITSRGMGVEELRLLLHERRRGGKNA